MVELMENAREAGADAAMVLPSFYYGQSQSEIIDHYTYINDHSGLDIMVYNNPTSHRGLPRKRCGNYINWSMCGS
ncbi:dihydrodipicolinate synthase family protein [Clostridium sp. AM58-1XD]|uniref:dihydrodipicolinate synthase family protein n=1 Tax=Clostridium sp. AM58-1XD TaxID=2292307 RepID=UPI000E50980C|nr:dihydrodipicolinate synthase family protein [Clostridium sp. AM58-1XD]RGY99672.1 hypothetical protein DXA13_07510 [Clostridium sp. AM58-1XD]